MSLPDPIVLLDARAKYVHPAFQLTRASTKAVFDAAGRMVTAPPNAIGWDHDPATGQARGCLAEPRATNLLLHSNDLTQAAWTKANTTVTPDAIVGPDGNGMAKVVEDSSSAGHQVRQSFAITDGENVTVSFIAKAGERARIRLYVMDHNFVSQHVRLDVRLNDGSVVLQTGANGATLIDSGSIDLGGGFYRVWIVGNLGAGVTTARIEVRLHDGSSDNYQGDGTSGLYVGYIQAEEGSYPTSYIETGGATATRAIERLTLPSITSQPWWRNDEWSMVIEYHNRGFELGANTLSNRILSFDNFAFMITYASTGRLRARGNILASAANEFLPPQEAQVLRRNRIAFAISDDGFQAAANGTLTSTDTVIGQLGDVPLVLGTSPSGADFAAATGNYRVTYYPARLSNADLQSLTAMQE